MHMRCAAAVTVADYREWYAVDAATIVGLAYLEGITDGRALFDQLARAAAKQPLVIVKGGATEGGAQAAASHTGSLATADRIFDGVCAQSGALRAPRVELLLCETLSSSREAAAAAVAAAGTGCEFWLSWTLQGSRPGHLPSGESVAEAFAAARDCGASAYLVNCCGANFVGQALPDLRALTDAPIGGYANAADAVPGSEPVAYTALDPEAYASAVAGWIDAGATLVGGCCSTRPAHIARVRELLDAR